ncbi:hypothetical protein JCM5353_003734 [Sporobolomyces roseus]
MDHPAPSGIPFGTKRTCEAGNLHLLGLIRLAREAYQFDGAAVRVEGGREYRKHPTEPMSYSLEEFFRGERSNMIRSPNNYQSAYALQVSTLEDLPGTKRVDIIIYTYPIDHESQGYERKLNATMSVNERADRVITIFNETYTTAVSTAVSRAPSTEFRHKCFDRSVKELLLRPDPVLRGLPLHVKAITVHLSASNQLFKAEKSWGRFLANEYDDERIAFEALSTLDAVCYNRTLIKSISTGVEGTANRKPFYRFVPDSKSERYFRKNSRGDFEEYRSHPPHGEPHLVTFPRPRTQASLGQRKARIYDDQNNGSASEEEEDRF